MFNFNQFSTGPGPSKHDTRWQRNNPKAKTSDNIEDAPYEDISNPHPSQSTVDRGLEIMKAFEERYKAVEDKSSLAYLSLMLAFSLGAKWADVHQASRAKGKIGFYSDLADYATQECKDLYRKGCERGENLEARAIGIHFVAITSGGEWAFENPIKK